MNRFSKIILALTLVMLALWQLPWCYAFFSAESVSVPFTLYSGLYGDFVSIGVDDSKHKTGIAADGKNFTQEETDSLLPFFYVRQLTTDGRLPDSIAGRAVTPRDIQMSNFMFRTSAAELNRPIVALYPLLESLSKRVDLEMPEDVFRITDRRIEFIRMATNSIDEVKSDKFTRVLLDKGFTFPSRYIAGNPTVKKDYDEGYLIVDHAGRLFHMKMMQGRPYVRVIELPDGFEVKHLFVTEFKDHKTLAFIVDTKNGFYVLHNKSYELFDTGIRNCDLDEFDMTIVGNMCDWTLWIDEDACRRFYAIDAGSYKIIREMKIEHDNPTVYGLHFTSPKDYYVYPRF